MSLYIIAVHKNSISKNKEYIGYRVFNTETRSWFDATDESTVNAMANGTDIKNAKIDTKGIKGVGGDLNRYTIIIDNKPSNKFPIIITKEFENGDYEAVNWLGEVHRMTEQNILRYGSIEGIANASIVDSNGKQYIRPIEGEFEKEEVLTEEQKEKKLSRLQAKLRLASSPFQINDIKELTYDGKEDEEVVIPSSVERIADKAFYGKRGIKVIHVPESVRHIGRKAFTLCIDLEKVVLMANIGTLESGLFQQCSKLKTVELSKSIKEIKFGAFKNCNKLEKIILHSRNVNIEFGALPAKCRRVYED